MSVRINPERILFGAAYYDEYMPVERLEQDMQMMRAIGINVIRIGESTWSTYEPKPNTFDFSHLDRVIEAAQQVSIDVIVGTPTYAVPIWLVSLHPEVLAQTPLGRSKYGPRQNINIIDPAYRAYSTQLIQNMVSHVAHYQNVIGYQIDNETKYYDVTSKDVQRLFQKHLRSKFDNDLKRLNESYGLDYWSNRINSWDDFPDITGSINASLRAEFDAFRRDLVTQFLLWQRNTIRGQARVDQFITHNFDLDWTPGWSYGIEKHVDLFDAAHATDIVGIDIYHPSEDDLTGKEIAFGGDLARSSKSGANYLVLETQAQGQNGWLPYPGQLRLQAYSHLASGANGVMYWPWHSIHHSYETYWKGLLSHDFESNPTYREAGVFARELKALKNQLWGFKKNNRVAIMISNKALTALDEFSIETGFPLEQGKGTSYNDIIRDYYDSLFELNVECDFINEQATTEDLSKYRMIITPALYMTDESLIGRITQYVANGGHLVSTVRSFVADENLGVWHDKAPHGLSKVFGLSYNQFTRPKDVALEFSVQYFPNANVDRHEACSLMELLNADTQTEVLARYRHHVWREYAAITRHAFGSGDAEWIGTLTDHESMKKILREALQHASLFGAKQELGDTITIRQGINGKGKAVTYFLNYSSSPKDFNCPFSGKIILGNLSTLKKNNREITFGSRIHIDAWGCTIVIS